MLALLRRSVAALFGAALLSPYAQALQAGGDECVHLVGYGGASSTSTKPVGSRTPPKLDVGICAVDDARLNRSTPIKTSADFVPITGDDSLGFYCVYGVKASATGGVGGNVGIFLFELANGEVLLFGSGYGNISGANLFDAAYDMERVDQIIRFCMGKTPAQTPIRVLAPHGHADHINPACHRELERLGYRIADIAFHQADLAMINAMGWTTADRALFRPLQPATSCLQELTTYSSPLGKLWVFERPGHTDGSIDLVIDVRNDPTNRFVVRGSQPSPPCAPIVGQREIVNAHGNMELFSVAPTLLDVAPLLGTSLGGTPLVLTGYDFMASGAGQHRVLVDGVPATNVVVVNDTTLTCTTPPGRAGVLVPVAVVNNNGKSVYSGSFYYNALPTLSSLSPTVGDWHGGTLVQMSGSGFLAGSGLEVLFGANKATSLTVLSDVLLTCRTPAGTPGATVNATARTANGQAVLTGGFRYNTDLGITALTPANGTSLGGTIVLLTGTGFAGNGSTPTVTFGGVAATAVTLISDTSVSCVAPRGTGGATVDVVLTKTAGSSTFRGYRYNALPSLATVSPSTGRTTGGTLVTLAGSGFQVDSAGVNQVRFGGVRATQTSVTVLSDGSLTCLTPAGVSGSVVNVTVTNLNGTATLPLAFTYQTPLVVQSLSPVSGTPLGGTLVTFTGSGFRDGPAGTNTVRFGAVAATQVTAVDDVTLTCVAPAGTPRAVVDVQVTNANGSQTLPGAFRYHAEPTLASLAPNHGHAVGFTPVTITGTGFLNDDAGPAFVVVGGLAASDVLVVSDTTLTCAVPPGVAGTTADVIIVNQNGSASLAGAFRYHAAPTLASASPRSGPSIAQTTVTLTGIGFQNDQAGTPAITFGGVPATGVSVTSDTSVRCNAPTGSAGATVDVVLTNARGAATLVGGFRYHARPRVTAVSPDRGTFQGGTQVTLTGSGFTLDSAGTNTVRFGSTPASNVVVLSDTSLRCNAPPGVLNAVVDVSVANANGTGTLVGGFAYSVPPPSLVGITPSSGRAGAPGTALITGAGFQSNSAGLNTVTFGGVAAAAVSVIDDTQLSCQVPPGTPGSQVDVGVSNANGSGKLVLGFRYHSLPVLSGVSPAAGSALGGATVQLSGAGFQADAPGTNLVTFGGMPASNVTVLSNTLLTCVAPAGTGGTTVDVRVSNANGSTEAKSFAYHVLPTLSSITPTVGPLVGGTSVTITGSGFVANGAGSNRVTFDGSLARSVVVLDDATLTCTTPANTAGYADVVLSNANGTATLPASFHYGKLPPALTSVEPGNGRASGANLVTLRGRGLLSPRTGPNRVKFGDVLSDNVITVDETTVLCSAPPGVPGRTVDVSLNNLEGTVTLAQAYRYNDLPTLVSVSPSQGPPLGTGPITLTGSGFASFAPGVTVVRFGPYVATDVVVLDDGRLTCRVSGAPAKSLDVSVSNDNGTATLVGAFRIGAPPRLTGVNPATGPFTGGTVIELSGSGFSEAKLLVTFGGVTARNVAVLADTLIRCTTPPGEMGRTVSVSVRTTYGGSTLVNGFTYKSIPPDLVSVAPSKGPASGGTRVTLNGVGFTAPRAGVLRVSFGAVPATNVVVLGDTSAACDAPPGTPGAVVEVRVENDNGSDALAGGFLYNDGPSLTGLSPAGGPAAGGTRVTLQGLGFLAEGAEVELVLFGGVAASDVLELSDTELACTAPPGTGGSRVDVTVINPNGQATLPSAFAYSSPPTLSAITPDHGPSGGAIEITLTGQGFQGFEAGTNSVTFGGVAATQVTVVSDTTVTCRLPSGTPGQRVDVALTNANGNARLSAGFRYHAEPTLTSVVPNRGPSAGGTIVTLNGTGFLTDDAGRNLVFIGSFVASDVTVISDVLVSCRTPGGLPAQLVDVTVINSNGSARRVDGFRYNPAPRVTSVSPVRGSERGGTTVTLTGAGFVVNSAGENSVLFGSTPATGVSVVNDTTLTCIAPPGPGGTSVDVRVTNTNGSDALGAAYRDEPAPALTALSPASGTALGGTVVTLTGSGFTATGAGTTLVSFGGVPALDVVVLDATRVRCTTPAGPAGVQQDVVVTNAHGAATLAAGFRRHALPGLSALAPARGSSTASTAVTLTGTGFQADGAGTNVVLFGAVAASNVVVVADTTLTCTVAPQAPGSRVDVRVTNANGAGLLADGFAFDPPAPTLTSVSPATGPASGGTNVTLTGTGFQAFSAGTNSVTFGGNPATAVVVVDAATITCQTPPGTTGASVDVAVSNANGSATLPAGFAYVTPVPTLTAVAPASGPAMGGGTVTLTGSGFQGGGAGPNTVTFGAGLATNVVVLSDTSLTCTVPAGVAGTSITVGLSNTNGSAARASGYRYHVRPVLSTASPSNGTSLGGTLVTLRGSGFQVDAAGPNQVLFGSTPANAVNTLDDTRVTCRVPSGVAGSIVTLTLSNANGSTQLLNGFRYNSRPTVTSVTPASGAAQGGNRVTVSGTGFLADGASVNIVSFGGVTATGVSVLSDSSIQCNVPAGTSGLSVQVTVTNVNGSGLLPNGYRYHARPTLTAVTPANGTPDGGIPVTLTGSGFQVDSPGPNSVTFGGVAATSIVVQSNTQLTCLTPPGTPGASVDVVLSNANGTATLPAGYAYDTTAAPVIVGTSPGRGPTVGATQVRLTGAGFQPGISVSFGSAPATDVVVVDARTIDCLTPPQPAGAWVDVTLTWPEGSTHLPLGFQYFTIPTLTSVEPPFGEPLGGSMVVLEGTGFLADDAGVNHVQFGGVPATSVVVYDDQHLACVVPAGPALTDADVLLTNDNGMASLARGFRWQRRLATDLDSDGRGDLVLSAPGDDTLGTNAGAVDLFFSTGLPMLDRTSAEADLKCLPERLSTAFGLPVVSGDLDGDGHAELVVGAAGDDVRGQNAGTVYVFGGPLAPALAPLPATQARTTLFSVRSYDRFGTALALHDLDRDGRLDLMVGAPGRTPGTVYVYRGGSFDAQVELLVYGEFGNEDFAASLAAGDLDGDGWPELVVGAPHAFGPSTGTSWNPGEVRVFRGGPAFLTTPDPRPWRILHGLAHDERFGETVAVRDLSGDGIADLVVGSPASASSGAGSGKVQVFLGGPSLASGSAASAAAVLSAEAAGDALGKSLAFGDVDGDGREDLLVGAPGHGGAGRAYLFLGSGVLASGSAASADAVLDAEAGTQGEFGSEVALVDIDGNGLDDMIVTAPALDSFGTDLGRVYVFGASQLAQDIRADDAEGKLTGSGAGDQLGRAMNTGH